MGGQRWCCPYRRRQTTARSGVAWCRLLPGILEECQHSNVWQLPEGCDQWKQYLNVERHWHVNDHTIYLHKDHVNEAELAQALAKALDVRSEADFYENLFRCTDDRQQKEKLLSKGIADAEINRCLREYSGPPAEKEHDEGHGKPTKGEQGGSTPQASSSGGSQGQQRKRVRLRRAHH